MNHWLIALAFLSTAAASHGQYDRASFHRLIQDGREEEVKRAIIESPELLFLGGETGGMHPSVPMYPIHTAALYSSAGLVKFMIEKGANPNAISYNRFTPLHFCAMSRGTESASDVARVLMEAGADAALEDSRGHSALQFAAMEGNTAVAEAMIDAGARVDLITATILQKSDLAKQLAQESPDRLTVGDPGPLFFAAASGDLVLVKLFVQLGANVNDYRPFSTGKGGGTSSLVAAAVSGHAEVVRYLLEKGANANVGVGMYSRPLLEYLPKDGNQEVRKLIEAEWEKLGEAGRKKFDEPLF